jgi:hypothetical protein
VINPEDRLRALLQELENDDDGDLVTGFVIIVKTAVHDNAGVTGYRRYWSGPPDELLGLLRYATLRAERMVAYDEGG